MNSVELKVADDSPDPDVEQVIAETRDKYVAFLEQQERAFADLLKVGNIDCCRLLVL